MRRFLIVFISFTIAMLLFGVSIATAGTASGGITSFSTGGRTYSVRSTVTTSKSIAQAYTETRCSTGVGAGYLGNYLRLYYSSGTLRASRGWNYSNVATISWFGPSCYIAPGVGNIYYSQGIGQGYNPSTGNYATCTSVKSPNQNAQ